MDTGRALWTSCVQGPAGEKRTHHFGRGTAPDDQEKIVLLRHKRDRNVFGNQVTYLEASWTPLVHCNWT